MKYRQGIKRLLTLRGWKQFIGLLETKEKLIFWLCLALFISSFVFVSASFYLRNTEIVPAQGGTHNEGIIGAPLFINPVFAQDNNADRDLVELIFSGLMKYNQQGELVPDLARDYRVLEDGQVFEFDLKENIFWSDGRPLTADDIIFTVKKIQNPALNSSLRASWLGVETEKISDLTVRFILSSPSAVFLENCTLKIMPKHIWQDIAETNFHRSVHNNLLNPIGSGPYKVDKVNYEKDGRIKSIELVANNLYHGSQPHITNVNILFFNNNEELLSALRANRLQGFSFTYSPEYENLNQGGYTSYTMLMPRYFAVFLNSKKNDNLENKKIRQSLNYAIDKNEIVDQVLSGQALVVNSPLLPEIYRLAESDHAYQFDPDRAKSLLTEAGFVEQADGFRAKITRKQPAFQFRNDLQTGSKGTEVQELQKCLANASLVGPEIYPEKEITGYFGEKTKAAVIRFQEKYKEDILTPFGLTSGTGRVLQSTRAKLNELCAPVTQDIQPLSLTLTTVDQAGLKDIAEMIKQAWQNIGIQTELEIIEVDQIKETIRQRDYQSLLFGQMLGMMPDLFPFWHSSQIRDPGYNLTSFESKEADELLEDARQSLDPEERKELLADFQEILLANAKAVFLYSPNYIYLVSDEIKGLSPRLITDPSKRFSEIESWYIKTKRSWR